MKVKLTEYGAAAAGPIDLRREDDRGAALAARARLGDYDEGQHSLELMMDETLTQRTCAARTDQGATGSKLRLSDG